MISLKDINKAIEYFEDAIKIDDQKIKSQAFYSLAILYTYNLRKFKEAEQYFRNSIKNGEKSAKAAMLWMFIYSKQKEKSDKLIRNSKFEESDEIIKLGYIYTLLWCNDTIQAITLFRSFCSKSVLDYDSIDDPFVKVLHLFIAKNQCIFVLNLFQNKEINLKDHFRPSYYALMHFMKDEYPDEILKMGSELEEPVQKIIKKIEEMAIIYA